MFTAREIADALGGITKQAVLARLNGTPADGPRTIRGQQTKAWLVQSLPEAMLAELEKLRVLPDGTERFRSIADLIAKVPPPYRPSPNCREFTASSIAAAEQKAAILAPLLSRRASTGTPLAVIARAARKAFAAGHRDSGTPSLRTIEEWLRTAERRDNGRHCFDRVDLWLSEAATPGPKGDGQEPDMILFPQVEAFLAECSSPLSKAARALLWHTAFVSFEAAVAEGRPPAATRRAAIDRLAHPSSPLYPATPEAIGKAWHRKLPIWQFDPTPESLADARKQNVGSVKFNLTDPEQAALRNLALKKDSFALAIEWFKDHPACEKATAELIRAELDAAAREKRRPNWPLSIRRAAYVSDEQRALFRGGKSFQAFEHCDRRGDFWEDEAGKRHPMAPGTIWESDDMSSNEPFRYNDPETGALRLGRQTLCTIDVHSNYWLGVSPIGRERDAYRVEDIADHLAQLVEAHGLPTHWRIERGVWDNQFVHGIEVDGPGGPVKWGGLGELIQISQTWKSRGKGTVETGFNFLQRLLAHESTSIGRVRGEFEKGTKLFLAAQRGDATAAGHFWTQQECADGFLRAMQQFNVRPKSRRALGKAMVAPADLWQSATVRKCPEDQLWRFLPVKRTASVRGGAIECSVPHYPHPFRFTTNGIRDGIYIEHGYRVLISFHPGRPENGCHIFNAETGARNQNGVKFGELIMVAPLAADAPQLSLSRDEQRFTARKAANAAVRSEFRAITKAGAPAIRASEARDGYGNRLETRSGSRVPAQSETGPGDELIEKARAAKTRAVDYDAMAQRIAEMERNDPVESWYHK